MAEKKASVSNTPSTVSNPTIAGQETSANAYSRIPGQTSTRTAATPGSQQRLFSRENYIWMLAGLVVIALGMFLMSGGKSADPNVFDQKEVYSPRRITVAPILIIIGLGLEVFAIFRKPKM